MAEARHLATFTRDLTVLYAEDDAAARSIMERMLAHLFKRVILAEDGREGLEKFRQNAVDIVVTDNLMPRMNGLDLIEEIRKTNITVPIVLITAYIDTEFLIKAINLGVTQFVAKPISFKNLLGAIEIAVQRVLIENLARTSQEQELELLKYRERYHFAQQERAFKKELNIIRNDLFLRKVDLAGTGAGRREWLIGAYYKPLDILSGDSYSVREIGEGRVVLFLADAMGKGLSASVSSILSTAFANHLIDEMKEAGVFDFGEFIRRYTKFIRRELLEDEIVSASFLYLDLLGETMEAALFSMPPMVCQTADGGIVRIKSNNMPLIRFLDETAIGRYDISSFSKILVHTDGLDESVGEGGALYQNSLENDFVQSHFKSDLAARFAQRVEKPEDDVTFIFLRRLDHTVVWERTFVVESRFGELAKATKAVEELLTTVEAGEDFKSMFINSLTEVLMNAYEHGNLNIDCTLKNLLTREGTYESYCRDSERENRKRITISLSLAEQEGEELLRLSVADEGCGFDPLSLQETNLDPCRISGRGIEIALRLSDELFYNRKGNEVTVLKKIDKGAGIWK